MLKLNGSFFMVFSIPGIAMESPWDSNESTLLTTPAVPTPGGVTFVAPTIPQRFVSRPAANKKRGRIFCRQNGFKKMCVGKYWADFEFHK